MLNDAGVICGPVYTIKDIFEDPQYRAREMLIEQVDPEFGPFTAPGIIPKFSETPGSVRWSATWEEGSHNAEVYGDLLGLERRRARRAEGRRASCDRGDDLRRRPARRAAERQEDPRARGARRARQPPRRGGRAAHRGGQLRQPGARARDGRRRGGRRRDRAARGRRLRRASRSTTRATSGSARPTSTRRTSPSPSRRSSTGATRARRSSDSVAVRVCA